MKSGAWKKVGLVLALSLGLVSSASAVVDRPTNADGSVTFEGVVRGTFDEIYRFNLAASPYVLKLFDNHFPNDLLTIQLQLQTGNGLTTLGSISGEGSFNFTTSAAGLYQAVVHAEPSLSFPSAGVFSATIAPVPEPEIWAMMLVGMGLVGFQARRRARAAQPA